MLAFVLFIEQMAYHTYADWLYRYLWPIDIYHQALSIQIIGHYIVLIQWC